VQTIKYNRLVVTCLTIHDESMSDSSVPTLLDSTLALPGTKMVPRPTAVSQRSLINIKECWWVWDAAVGRGHGGSAQCSSFETRHWWWKRIVLNSNANKSNRTSDIPIPIKQHRRIPCLISHGIKLQNTDFWRTLVYEYHLLRSFNDTSSIAYIITNSSIAYGSLLLDIILIKIHLTLWLGVIHQRRPSINWHILRSGRLAVDQEKGGGGVSDSDTDSETSILFVDVWIMTDPPPLWFTHPSHFRPDVFMDGPVS